MPGIPIDSILTRLERHLPHWAHPDNPILDRERDLLPPLPLRLNRWLGKGVMTTLLLVLAPLALLGGSVPVQLLLVPFSWLSLIWAAPVISREARYGTWDLLRTTPYSSREIVLAKISAVAHHLAPVLTFILIGQLASLAVLGLFSLPITHSADFVGIDGAVADRVVQLGLGEQALAGGIVIALMLFAPVLDYVLNITLGVLISTMTQRPTWAVVGAFVTRLVLSGLFIALAMLAASITTGRAANPFYVLSAASLVGSPGWTLALMPDAPGAMVTTAMILFLAPILVLGVALALTFRRVERAAV